MQAQIVARGLYGLLNSGHRIQNWTRSQGNLYQAIQASRQMVLLMLMVVVAVAAMNIVTAMIMVVQSKRQDIAMLMTMGLPAKRALLIILVQGLIIGLFGIGLGLLLGVGLSLSVDDVLPWLEKLLGYQFLKSDIYPISYLPTRVLWQDIVSVCIPALVISLLSALYPAWRATKILPAQALRYDK